ncbi:MAG: MopE-related protein [Nanoarchaeota archaeon]|nr:MopE-related protein [Nanoarchaeota archaeon]
MVKRNYYKKSNYIVWVIIILIILALVVYFYRSKNSPSLSPIGECVFNGNEVCDNIDNDCNNKIDDGLGNYTCGVGACKVSDRLCARGIVRQCTPGMPSTEVCNDEIDNNCNGKVDEEGCV